MLEDIKKLVGEHIEAAKKHDVQYLPWDVTNAFLLVTISEQIRALQEAVCRLQDQDDRHADGGPWSAEVTSESLGDPLDWSDSDLDKLAAIGDDDLATAVKLWGDNAPEVLVGLLNAEEEHEQA